MSTQGWTKTDETGIWTDGSRYRVRTTATTPDGELKQTQRTLPEGKTLEGAVEVRESLKEEIRTPDRPSPEEHPTTMACYANQWLRRKANEGLTPRTLQGYRRELKQWILPRLGHLDLEAFSRHHVLDWISWATNQTHEDGTPYATETVRRWWGTLRNVLRDAHADGYLDRDPTQRVPAISTGRNGVRDIEALTADELREFIDAAREAAPRRYAELVTLALTGMRSGELWSLHWSDLDRSERSIHIHRSVSAGEIVDRTKTDVDRRVPMHPLVDEAIDEHRTRMMEEEQDDRLATGLVFPSHQATVRTPGSLRKAIANTIELINDRRQKRADGEPEEWHKHVSPQVLRKTFVTLMRMSRVDEIISESIVGHETSEMQRHYASPSVSQKREALDSVFELKGGETG
ncbi:MAG: tyrosine-type recombinase/integrase [Bradymonadaceae bacterium]